MCPLPKNLFYSIAQFSFFSLFLHFHHYEVSGSGLRRQLSSPLNPNGNGPPDPSSSNNATGGKGHHKPHGHTHHDFSDEEDDFSSHSSDSPPDDPVIIRKNSKSHPHNRVRKFLIISEKFENSSPIHKLYKMNKDFRKMG